MENIKALKSEKFELESIKTNHLVKSVGPRTSGWHSVSQFPYLQNEDNTIFLGVTKDQIINGLTFMQVMFAFICVMFGFYILY